MIRGLAHACFVTTDLDRAVAFYRDVLGMEPAFEFLDDRGRRFGQYLHIGGRTFLELFEARAAEPAGDRSAFRHLCLETDDLEAEVERLRTQGVEVSDPKVGSDRSWQAWLSDPDGNRIELHEYTSESKQQPFV